MPVATDMVFLETPAIDGGETAAQIFVGTKSFVTNVDGMKSESQFVNTLLLGITFAVGGALTSSVIEPNLRSAIRSRTSYAYSLFQIGRVSHGSSIRTLVNTGTRPSS
jgi:hypothetical protein